MGRTGQTHGRRERYARRLAGPPRRADPQGRRVMAPGGLGVRGVALLSGGSFTFAGSRRDAELAGEFQGTRMLVSGGAMLTSSANELVLLFLGLELISIPTYVPLFLGRRDRASAEATMKYFYLSLLASALLLYGFAFLYGISGTTVIVGSGEVRGIREAFLNQYATGIASSLFKLAPVALALITPHPADESLRQYLGDDVVIRRAGRSCNLQIRHR